MGREVLEEGRLRRLIDVGRGLAAHHDLEAVLDEVVEAARELAGARHATLDVHGGGEADVEGRGGVEPAVRHPDVGMLDVPVVFRGRAYGTLRLSEKTEGEFDEADEEAVAILAELAAVSIFNARLHGRSEEERRALERALHGLEATTEIARAVAGETDRSRVLETIARRVRALVGARSLLVLLREGERLQVAAAAGVCGSDPVGRYLTLESPTPDEALQALGAIGLQGDAALLAPLSFRGRSLGAIVALDRPREGGSGFLPEDERMLIAASASAATAVATVQSVTEERLRHSLRTAERERAHWARELHDSVLQGLGSRRVTLSSALKRGDPAGLDAAVGEAIDDIARDIEELRALITELRPATLDQIGLRAALEDLAERVSSGAGIELATTLAIEGKRLEPELETVVYRLVQEALNNVAKHAAAGVVTLQVVQQPDRLDVLVADDGCGFDLADAAGGFGLIGMRERVELVGGDLWIESGPGSGTRMTASVPLSAGTRSGLDEPTGERAAH